MGKGAVLDPKKPAFRFNFAAVLQHFEHCVSGGRLELRTIGRRVRGLKDSSNSTKGRPFLAQKQRLCSHRYAGAFMLEPFGAIPHHIPYICLQTTA